MCFNGPCFELCILDPYHLLWPRQHPSATWPCSPSESLARAPLHLRCPFILCRQAKSHSLVSTSMYSAFIPDTIRSRFYDHSHVLWRTSDCHPSVIACERDASRTYGNPQCPPLLGEWRTTETLDDSLMMIFITGVFYFNVDRIYLFSRRL